MGFETMTTAHRATWKAARGGLQEEGSFQLHVPSAAVSSKDAPTERQLKLRAEAELSRGELRARLEGPQIEGGEPRAKRARTRFAPAPDSIEDGSPPLLTSGVADNPRDGMEHVHNPEEDHSDHGGSEGDGGTDDDDDDGFRQISNPEDTQSADVRASVDEIETTDKHATESKIERKLNVANIAGDTDGHERDIHNEDHDHGSDMGKQKPEDALSADGCESGKENKAGAEEDASDDSGSESDSSDDEAELIAEMERIRKEREFERAKKQAEEQERIQRVEADRVATENPLLGNLSGPLHDEISETASVATGSVAFSVRRRWDDDLAFRNQAGRERTNGPRMINDTIRNDFHRRFMKRYMR